MLFNDIISRQLGIYYVEEIMRETIILSCTECGNRNYNTQKNKKNNPERIQMKKFCPTCKKRTVHKESK